MQIQVTVQEFHKSEHKPLGSPCFLSGSR